MKKLILIAAICCFPVLAFGEMPKKPTVTKNSVGMKLVLIPKGRFLFGAPDSDRDATEGEKPQRRIAVPSAFFLGQTEVTMQQWSAVMQYRPWARKKQMHRPSTSAGTMPSNSVSGSQRKKGSSIDCQPKSYGNMHAVLAQPVGMVSTPPDAICHLPR